MSIEVRIYRDAEVRETAPCAKLSDVQASVEKLLDHVMDCDGHEARSPLLRGWIGAQRDAYFVRVFVAGEEWSLCDLCCTAEECGRDLDSQPGWTYSGEHADFELRCPTHAAAERMVA